MQILLQFNLYKLKLINVTNIIPYNSRMDEQGRRPQGSIGRGEMADTKWRPEMSIKPEFN